ncbi:uncharacterized protein LOC133806662 [Humulus lupulus]|uniref:uncharacterized protein LOC133806662 n=1 Tax=Humulus lupulus TaxID=3486 RepID=UPI002B404BA8|nr:uncharacterized protein LOC133806662 [Humulus lupulus]
MFSRIKSKIFSISSGRSSPSSMQTPNNNDLQLGLKTLIHTQPESSHLQSPRPAIANNHDQKILHSHSHSHSHSRILNHSSSSSSLSPSEQPLDDIIIGSDSGVHYILTDDSDCEEMSNRNLHVRSTNRRRKRTANKEHRHYPPPIPMVAARTGNLGGGAMPPWVLSRHNKDGRLILKGHRAQHHQYLECHRENGRLIVNLVTIDQDTGGSNTNTTTNDDDDDDDDDEKENHEFEFEDLAVVEEENHDDHPWIESQSDHELELNNTSIRDRVWSSISDELSYLEIDELSINPRGMLMADSMSLGCNNTNININIIHESHHLYLSQSPGSSSSPLRPMTSVIN